MKTKDLDAPRGGEYRLGYNRRKPEQGLHFGTAGLGLLCAAGVFGLLALLYHIG